MIKRRYDFEVELLCTNSCILAISYDRELICHKGKTYKAIIENSGVRFKVDNYYTYAFRISDIANDFVIKQTNIVKADKIIMSPITEGLTLDCIPTNPVPSIIINGKG